MTGKHLYIYSPSGAVRDKAAFRRGVAFLKKRGYDVEVDSAALSSHQRFAGTDDVRVAAIARAAASQADAALISRGGYGITRILPDIPFKAVAQAIERGTQFVGISDFTALQLALMAHSGRGGKYPVSWAGPALCEGFGATTAAAAANQDTEGHGEAPGTAVDDIMLACFEDMMVAQGEGCGWRQNPATAVNEERVVRHATLWGGNVTMLCSLVGTPYLPKVAGGILFLEDVAEHPYRLERLFTQLLHAGILQKQKAVLLGQFTEYKLTAHDRGYSLKSVVAWLQSRLPQVTFVTGLPFGHVPTKVLLPVGARCDLVLQGRDALLAWGHLS